MPRLLALDFDGVIADSAPEAFVVALRTWSALRPDAPLAGAPAWRGETCAPARDTVERDPLYRAFLAIMPLGNRAEDYGVALEAIARRAALPDQDAYDRFRAGCDAEALRRFHREFYRARTALAAADAAGWHGLVRPYPGVCGLLRRHAAHTVLAIATAKDRRSVGLLLEAWGARDLFDEGRILDKETGEHKTCHLEHLHRELGVPWAEMAFVDDKVKHLDAVAALGVRCALAAWGYNGPREVAHARAAGHLVLTLDDAEAQLFGGGKDA